MRLTHKLFILSAIVALVVIPSASVIAQDNPTPTTPVSGEVLPPTPLDGQASYIENCAPCHGSAGQGDGPSASGLSVPPIALADRATMAGRTPLQWFDITKNGNMARMMPPWKNRLNDQQIWDTVAYAWSLQTTRGEVDQGQAVFEANCASCHGADGKGVQPGAPDLSDFALTSQASDAEWDEIVSEGRGEMPGFADKLSEAERIASVTYARSLSLAGPLFRPALAEGSGVISGTVTNKTTGLPVPDLTVQLGIFDQTSQLEMRSATTDGVGFYRFDALPVDSSLAFAVRVAYPENVPYNSDFVTFEGGATELDLPISVFETTNDGSGVRAERVHYIMEFGSGAALVAELIVFSLDGDRAFVGDGNHVLRFPLPAGAQQLTVNDGELGERFIQIENGFVDLLPMTPGENTRQILFRYALPLTGADLEFTRSLPYPAAAVNALISDVGAQVTSEDMAGGERRATEGGAYLNFIAQDVAANQPIRISIAGIPASASASGTGVATGAASGTGAAGGINRWLLIGLIAAVAALAAFLVALPLARARRGEPISLTGESLDRDALVDALAQLDLDYEAGDISESAYRDQRLRLKAQLRDSLRREQGA